MISGINGSNCILSSMVKARVESKLIDSAEVIGSKGSFNVIFKGSAGEWKGEPIYLSSSRQPYEPRVFKSIDGAISELLRVGLTQALVRILDNNN